MEWGLVGFTQYRSSRWLAGGPTGAIRISAAIALSPELDDASARDWASWIADNRLRIFQEIEWGRAHRRNVRLVGLAMRTADGNLLTAAELKRIRREVRAAFTR